MATSPHAKTVLAIAVAVLGLFAAGSLATTRAPQDRPPPPVEFRNRSYEGFVTEVAKTSLTITAPERTETIFGPGPAVGPGSEDRVKKVLLPALPPKTFAASEVLAAGEVPRHPRQWDRGPAYSVDPYYMYRLTDVRVGDWVSIRYARVSGTDVCDHICIGKRPGGRVPPLPESVDPRPKDWPDFMPYIRYHDWVNAKWDLEERGIPYPEWFGKQRRWPEAPMPRLVTPPAKE